MTIIIIPDKDFTAYFLPWLNCAQGYKQPGSKACREIKNLVAAADWVQGDLHDSEQMRCRVHSCPPL